MRGNFTRNSAGGAGIHLEGERSAELCAIETALMLSGCDFDVPGHEYEFDVVEVLNRHALDARTGLCFFELQLILWDGQHFIDRYTVTATGWPNEHSEFGLDVGVWIAAQVPDFVSGPQGTHYRLSFNSLDDDILVHHFIPGRPTGSIAIAHRGRANSYTLVTRNTDQVIQKQVPIRELLDVTNAYFGYDPYTEQGLETPLYDARSDELRFGQWVTLE